MYLSDKTGKDKDRRATRLAPQGWGFNLLNVETSEIALGVSEVRSAGIIGTFLLSHLPQREDILLHTDMWAATMSLDLGNIDGFQVSSPQFKTLLLSRMFMNSQITHKAVNHSKEFKSDDEVHINNVERKNRSIRDMVFHPLNGVSRWHTPLHCNVFQCFNNGLGPDRM